ncbi:MAG: Spy/CpxP family protein refolding chaperone [Chthoniobacterales bacterium]
MKPTFIALTIAGVLTLGTIGLYAEENAKGGHPFMQHGGHGGFGLEHMTKQLDLTPDQQAKVAPIVEAAKPQIKAIHEEAMQKTRAIMENTAAQIRPLLTPDQQAKFDAMKKAHEDMMNAMREMHQAATK